MRAALSHSLSSVVGQKASEPSVFNESGCEVEGVQVFQKRSRLARLPTLARNHMAVELAPELGGAAHKKWRLAEHLEERVGVTAYSSAKTVGAVESAEMKQDGGVKKAGIKVET
jgi:hypothetical protein